MKIIVDVGSNFSTEKQLLDAVGIAASCGVDAIKYQLYSEADLYGFGSEQYNFDPDLLPMLASEARIHGIEFMCSAFSVGAYDYVNGYVDTHKIASCEITAKDILTRVNSYGKPVIFSCGGSTLTEAHAAEELLKDCDRTAMWCVGDYPAKIIDFRMFQLFHWALSQSSKIGFSDHSIDVLNIPMKAKEYGAVVIEKHVDFFDSKSADSAHSLNSHELAIMCAHIKGRTFHVPKQSVGAHKRVYNKDLDRWIRPKK